MLTIEENGYSLPNPYVRDLEVNRYIDDDALGYPPKDDIERIMSHYNVDRATAEKAYEQGVYIPPRGSGLGALGISAQFIIWLIITLAKTGWDIYNAYQMMVAEHPEVIPQTTEEAEGQIEAIKREFPSIPLERIREAVYGSMRQPPPPEPKPEPQKEEGIPVWAWVAMGFGAFLLLKGSIL